jgi:AhpD family alkylhydroperoxidase
VKFNKRTYRSWKEFFTDVKFIIENRRAIIKVMRKGTLTPSFRERLMLAVTAVNGCRYCSYFHTGEALKKGLTAEEIRKLLDGDLENCPQEEAVALLYAQHWAESDVNPSLESTRRLEETYSTEKAEAINLILRMIRVGNLLGNTWDWFLYRVSFGKRGI